LLSDLVVLVPTDPSEPGRAGAWLGVIIDPAAFFRQIVAGGREDSGDLAWALIDRVGRVVASSDGASFPPVGATLPQTALQTLYVTSFARIPDGRGKTLLAKLSAPLPMMGGSARLFVAADSMMLDGPIRTEAIASLALNIFFGSISVALAWLFLRRAFLPYRRLVEAVKIFAEGGTPMLPHPSKGEIGYLIGAFGDLIARVSVQREILEREVESRTGDLFIMNAVTRALALSVDDDRAYQSMLLALRDGLGAELGLVVFFDGKGQARVVFAEGRPSLPLDPSMLAEVEAASRRGGGGALVLGETYGGCVGTRLAIDEDLVGFVLIGRRGGSFRPREVEAISRSLRDLAPLVYERRERSRREETKSESERELRRSEERLRTFFEESRDMIYIANGDDTIAWINAAGIELLGLSDRFDAVGHRFSEFALSGEDREHFLGELRARGYARDYEIVLKKADGGTMFCIETVHSIRTRDGSMVEIQGIVKDISERINKEKELVRANLELNRANTLLRETQMLVVQREKLASIGQLSAGIAHEINNPLGFLKSNHEVLRDFLGKLRAAWEEAESADPPTHARIARRLDLDYVFAEASQIVRESDDGFRRIVEIVGNLRNFAREDSDVAFSDYDVEEGIRSTLIVARNAIKYVATVDFSKSDLPHVKAAGGEINQVLLNIVMNAVQAIEGQKRQGEGHIAIATFPEGDHVVVSIDDDGPGVPEALKLRIFDPFFTTKEPGRGTGLGLSISYDIVVNKHGGRLVVGDSRLGGASFRIELPIEPQAKAANREDPGPEAL
jgi:PAS domain S-box-containing protein